MENHLVTILRITSPRLGSFVKDKFEAKGIECFFTNEGMTIGSQYNPDEVLLKVKVADSEKAIKILLQIHKEYDLDKIGDDNSLAQLKKILVPVKLGSECIALCKYAMSLAQKTNAEIKLLYVYPDPTVDESDKHTVSWEKYVQMELKEAYLLAQTKLVNFSVELKKQIPEDLFKSVKLHYRMLKGIPEYVIADAAARYNPDLILMGTRGGRETGEFEKSTVKKVVETIGFPLLVVPVLAAFKGSNTIKVMYATDFYETDKLSFDKLFDILNPYQKEIFCVHIDLNDDEHHQEKVEELNNMLRENYSQQNIRCVLYQSDDVAEGIQLFAEKNNIDIISFSKIKRSAFYKMFHANLFGKIVSVQKVPMLIFPV